eukprot:TRINITY_DN402_c0_g1_i2.p1 TRINITY_DN402_c0_g1~~TRINITY_DN402_c0_g1_i2.p1  ORF type:complete len:127 (-),score=17.50 TRINITY_DN402_c0_g1_i2:230-610(-)
MKKIVVKLSLAEDPKTRQKAFKSVAGLRGVISLTMDTKETKFTVIGDIDPVDVTMKLRKFGFTELISVGPEKEEKKQEKKEEKKEEKKQEKDPSPMIVYERLPAYNAYPTSAAYTDEHYDSGCTIC